MGGIDFTLEQLAAPDDLLEASRGELTDCGVEDVFQAAYSADVWSASDALSRALIDLDREPRIVEDGQTLLELGCGCGALPSIVAARLRNVAATATDASLPALAIARDNAARNGVRAHAGPLPGGPPPGEIELWVLDWSRRETWLPRRFDVVVAGDTIYEEKDQIPLCETAIAHVRPGGLVVVVSATRRTEENFPRQAEETGLVPLVREDIRFEWDGKEVTARFDYLRAPPRAAGDADRPEEIDP